MAIIKNSMKKGKTISEYFDLKRTQYDLDFFDCFINEDTPLFIDPWAIRCGKDEFSENCYQKIHSVFSVLIEHIKNQDEIKALDLLDNLHEPSETGLGYTDRGKKGSAVGGKKSKDIYNILLKSKAVKTGLLKDLEDTALHIDGIGPDNISDIITNIIRYDLIKYTKEQCDFYDIETHETTTKTYWNEQKKDFDQGDEESLIVDGKKILLVPKKFLRKGLSINYSDFYNKGILEFEQARHWDARTSLCRTLKDKKGITRIVAPPYKKTLKNKYPLSRGLVFKYINENPELLINYKNQKIEQHIKTISNDKIIQEQNKNYTLKDSIDQKIKKFSSIKPGKDQADEYHNHISDCLNLIFNDSTFDNYLNGFKKEYPQNERRKKVDIKFFNAGFKGFFSRLANYGNLFCAKIFFECKNFSHDLSNPEYDQMLGRFNKRESTIGYIVCRKIENKEASLKSCKDFLKNLGFYIFVLTDEDIISMLKALLGKDRDIIISDILQKKMDELIDI